jgi:hypothetical protein
VLAPELQSGTVPYSSTLAQTASECVIRNQVTIMSEQTCACSNVVESYVGVPDLVVEDMWLDPPDAGGGQPVTISVRIANRGTGMAWNPENGGGFYTDVYLGRSLDLLSCGFPGYGDVEPLICNIPIPPDEARTFSRYYPDGLPLNGQQLLYVRADVHEANPYGLVPESNECNNVFPDLDQDKFSRQYLPLLSRNLPFRYLGSRK